MTRYTYNRIAAGTAIVLSAAASGCLASTQQEVQLGQQYAAQINQQLPLVRDAEIVRYINVLGDSIARVGDDRNLDWHFYVVDSPEINAFAVPGGYVYVNRGLIEAAQNMSQLAGVLGHEIGHVEKRHSMQQMRDMERANVGVGLLCVLTTVCQSQVAATAINVGGSAVFAKFSREDESEADAVGVANVVRAGIDPRGIPEMFRILLNMRRQGPGAVDAWFSTHPLEEDRIAATQAMIAKIDPAILSTLTTDTQGFRNFRARVKALPPSPKPAR